MIAPDNQYVGWSSKCSSREFCFIKLRCILSRNCLGFFLMDASVLFQRFKALAWNVLSPDVLLKMGTERLFFFEALVL